MQYRFSISPIPFNTSLDFNEIIEYIFFFENRYHVARFVKKWCFMYYHKIP